MNKKENFGLEGEIVILRIKSSKRSSQKQVDVDMSFEQSVKQVIEIVVMACADDQMICITE